MYSLIQILPIPDFWGMLGVFSAICKDLVPFGLLSLHLFFISQNIEKGRGESWALQPLTKTLLHLEGFSALQGMLTFGSSLDPQNAERYVKIFLPLPFSVAKDSGLLTPRKCSLYSILKLVFGSDLIKSPSVLFLWTGVENSQQYSQTDLPYELRDKVA